MMRPMETDDGDRDLRTLDRLLAQLSEHFDSVQIIATRHERDRTISANRGTGDWYSRYGAVREWLIQQDERAREQIRGEDE